MTYTIQNSRKALRYPAPPVRVAPPAPGRAPLSPEFRGAALALQAHRGPFVVIGGPAETGKTYAALWYVDAFLRAYAGAQGALVRKVRVTIAPTVLRTYLRLQAMYGDQSARAYGGNSPVWFDYPNGSRLWIGGMDDPGKVLSGERDIIYGNQIEELDEADVETLTTRATGRGAVAPYTLVLGDCNPGGEDHWIIRKRDAGALALLESRHEDNPTLYTASGDLTEQGHRTMAVLDALTGVRYQRLRLGRWVGAEGAYFAQLDERLHMCDLRRVPLGWRAWGALDYGFAHPLSFGIFTMSPVGELSVVGLHHQARWYVPQHHEAMAALCAEVGVDWRTLVVSCGHDLWASRGGDDPETVADKFAKRGWRLERATIARRLGAQAVAERLGNAEAGVPVTLRFGPRARGVFQTLARMVPDPHDPEDVKKVDADANGRGGDDDYDMCRYGVMAAPPLARRAAVGGERALSQSFRPR